MRMPPEDEGRDSTPQDFAPETAAEMLDRVEVKLHDAARLTEHEISRLLRLAAKELSTVEVSLTKIAKNEPMLARKIAMVRSRLHELAKQAEDEISALVRSSANELAQVRD